MKRNITKQLSGIVRASDNFAASGTAKATDFRTHAFNPYHFRLFHVILQALF